MSFLPTPYPPLTTTTTKPISPTKIFINNVPQYTLLPSCAEQQVSSIVRDMNYGCGDNSELTSYACFCSTSSAYFSSVIGEQVRTACGTARGSDEQQVTADAVGVFSRYCEMGQTVVGSVPIATVSASISYAPIVPVVTAATTSTSNSALEVPAIPSQTPITITITSKPLVSRTATIVIAVLVPLLVILLLAAGILFWRPRRNRMRRPRTSVEEVTKSIPDYSNLAALQESESHTAELPVEENGPYFMPELPLTTKTRRSLIELSIANLRFSIVELPGTDVPDRYLREFRFT